MLLSFKWLNDFRRHKTSEEAITVIQTNLGCQLSRLKFIIWPGKGQGFNEIGGISQPLLPMWGGFLCKWSERPGRQEAGFF